MGFPYLLDQRRRPTCAPRRGLGLCSPYLMGNHIFMERMFRYQPAVVMYAPLHVAIWSHSDGQAHFTIDKPSDQFRSFSDSRVTEIGDELDSRLAALLKHLHLEVPNTLAQEVVPRLHGH